MGEGGFGNVYKGYLKSVEQVCLIFYYLIMLLAFHKVVKISREIFCVQTVAVKVLNREGAQGTREFFAEILMLSMVQHPNLVRLIGYCVDDHHRILVYEFMANGSLENHLLGMMPKNSGVGLILEKHIVYYATLTRFYLCQTWMKVRSLWIGRSE